MKTLARNTLATLVCIFFCSLSAIAQEGLKINSVFEQYGKRKGSTMVVLSGKALERYKLDKYQSITLAYDRMVSEDIQKALETDKEHAEKIKEVISNGSVSLGYYKLSPLKHGINRYILFKVGNDGLATLIYIEGGEGSEEMINQLFLNNK